METAGAKKLNVALFPTLMDLSKRTTVSVSTQEHDTSIKETRRMIFECMKNLLGDSNEVQLQLRREVEGTPQPLVVLQFVHHCVCVLPQCYISLHTNDDAIAANSKDDPSDSVFHTDPKVFTIWIIARLLNLVSSPGCAQLHKKIIEILTSIMQLARSKDSAFFQTLCLEFIALIEDMNKVAKKYFKTEHELLEIIVLKRFCRSGCFENPSNVLKIKSAEECVALQRAVCSVLQDIVPYVCQFVAFSLERIWTALTFVVKEYPQSVADEAMHVLSQMWHASGYIHRSSIRELADFIAEELCDRLRGKKGKSISSLGSGFWSLLDSLMPEKSSERNPRKSDSLISLLPFFGSRVNWILDEITNVLSNREVPLVQTEEETICDLGLRCLYYTQTRRLVIFNIFSLIKALQDSLDYSRLDCDVFVKLLLTAELMYLKQKIASTSLSVESSSEELDSYLKDSFLAIVETTKSLPRVSSGNGDVVMQICDQMVKMYGVLSMIHIRINVEGMAKFQAIQFLPLCYLYSDLLHELSGSSETKESLTKIYAILVKVANKLLDLLDDDSSSGIINDFIMDFVSLPWESTKDWLSYEWKPKVKSSSSIGILNPNEVLPLLDDTAASDMMQLLLKLPRNSFPLWKLHIWKQLLGYINTDAGLQAIKYLPYLLSTIDHSLHKDILQDVQYSLQNTQSYRQHESIKQSIRIVCALSGNCTIKHLNPNELISKEGHDPEMYLFCSLCEGDSGVRENVSAQPVWFLIEGLSTDIDKEMMRVYISGIQAFTRHIACEGTTADVSYFWKPFFNLISDHDHSVRIALSEEIRHFIARSDLHKIQEAIINKLKETFMTARDENNVQMLETTCFTLGNIGKVTTGDLLMVIIISLLECLITKLPSLNAIAFEQIQEIAEAKGLSCQQLFDLFCTNICEFLVSKFHDHLQQGRKGSFIVDSMTDVACAFEFRDVKTLLQCTTKVFLPRIVQLRDQSASLLLRTFAKYLDVNRREMLLHNFKYIFPFLVYSCNGNGLEGSLTFLQKETDVELGSLLRSECQNTFNHLMLHLCNYQERVFTGLSILACSDSSYNGSKELRNNIDRASYIHSRLLGALAFFNQVLTCGEDKERLLVMRSLVELLKIMGPSHITPVRLKVMALLALGMKTEDLQFLEVSCDAWKCFVSNVELTALGPMLGQIVVILMPLLEKFADRVSSIFYFLLVQNKSVMEEYFGEVYFMPDIPVLNEVQRVLKACRRRIQCSKDFKVQLMLCVKGIKHENSDVRKYALRRTAELLTEHQEHLVDITLGSETVDPVVVKLVGTLVGCSKGADKETRNLIGLCLGEVGAVDPGRLENLGGEKEEDTMRYKGSVRDKDFAVDLINVLCHAFLAANDTRSQDCSAYAIQEILQFYNCGDTNENSVGYQIWHAFPQQTQELMQPHLHSKYVHTSRNNWSKISSPVFGSDKGRTFKEWICTLVGFQISKIQDSVAAAVFTPCLSIIKYDLKTALFIFPHVLSHCITESTSSAAEILTEVLSVLQASCKQEIDNVTICTQTIFTLVDFIEQSVERQRSKELEEGERSKETDILIEFLKKIPKDVLAKAAFNCKSNSRALMYFESYLGNDDAKLQSNLPFLQELYYALNEPDGISGISAIRRANKSLHEQIIEHESSGRLLDAAACYERGIQLEMDQVTYYQGLLRSLIGLGQLNSALMNADGVITKRPEWTDDLRPYQAEAAWRLGRWENLSENLEAVSGCSNWSIALGKVLLDIKNKDMAQFELHLKETRSELMIPLSAASLETGAYERAYESVLRLHMLQEVEHCSKLVMSETPSTEKVKDLIKYWELRYNETRDSFRTREPLLNLRRILVNILPDNGSKESEIDNCWIRVAKIARKAGHYSTAFNSLLNVVESLRPDTMKEHSKLLWAQGDCHQALMRLQKGSSDIKCIDQNQKSMPKFAKLSVAKVQLLVGRWMEETESFEPEQVLFHYKGVVEANGDWEKSQFYLAKYYERLMNACGEEPTNFGKPDFVKFVVRHYAMSLQYGSKWIYQSMPKLLSLWLDFGVKAWTIEQDKKAKHSEKALYREKLNVVNESIAHFSRVLPGYQFLTAFSQLISRICHPNPSVWNLLEEIISRLLLKYKQQAIWNMVSVSKSSFKTRSQRCHQIFSNVSNNNLEMRKFIDDVINLTDRLLEICNKKVPGREPKLSLSKDFGVLKRMLLDSNFSSIIIPLQSTMTVILPSGSGSHVNFSPFPESLPYFANIDDTIGVLHSLQKPKKIMIKGSDGSIHPMMCKPKDDLRKDCRLMEFNSLVNKLLLRDADCRRRQLHIRTYAVIPLNEECGVLEWVQNTTGLRHILNQLYKEKGVLMKVSELKKIYDTMNSMDTRSKIHAFQSQVLPRHPPLFQEWFVRSFPTPSKWYMARLAYCRTSAVMSMVGYTLGLGDRHGENILFDSTTGDCVHVDFNCLFNKGQTFDFPERVPFRLTHNLVSAMGPLGHEGIYRSACEVTLKLMRNQRDSLLSVLHSFLYDPLVEWTKERKRQMTETGEVTNEKAVKILKDIEQRLCGYYSGMKIRLPLSIEGQVHQLIKEATDLENLSQMYIGWAAYL